MSFVTQVGPREPITRSRILGQCRKAGMSDEQAERNFQRMLKLEWWGNETYTVSVDRDCEMNYFAPEQGIVVVHLSIHRRDRASCVDWRDFQRIKNDVVGEEVEGAQLHPAESRVVDTSNEFHIWCLTRKDGGALPIMPFGFPSGCKLNDTIVPGSKQRPLEGA